MTKQNIYNRGNCTCSDQPKPPSNSSIRLYTSIMCISGHIPKNGIQTSIFHPTTHENIESILVSSVQVYHHPKTKPIKVKLNPTQLTQATF